MIIRATNLSPIESPGGNATAGIATPTRGAAEVSLIRQRQQPGGQNPLHRHDRQEVVLVESGRITLTAGDVRSELAAGDAAIIPAETLHQIHNAGAEPAEWLLIAPQGIRYFGADGAEMEPAWAK
jgi:quercetin dioxygenase-like cupin family protein